MTNDEFKQHIQSKTGIPAELLTGETPEDDLALAASLLAFKQENTNKSTAEQFADWMNGEAPAAPQSVDEPHKYPVIHDAGELPQAPRKVPACDQFAEWAWKIGLTGF